MYSTFWVQTKIMRFSLPFDDLSKLDPLKIAISMGLITIICIFFSGFFSEDDTPWMVAMSGLLLYAWLVPVLSFISQEWAKHSFKSVISYIVLGVIYCFLAGYVSGFSIFELREYQLLISAMTMFFIVGVFMSRVLRGIAKFMEQG